MGFPPREWNERIVENAVQRENSDGRRERKGERGANIYRVQGERSESGRNRETERLKRERERERERERGRERG